MDAFITAVGGRRIPCTVSGPYGEPVEAFYGLLDDNTAIVEMAAAAGLPLVEERKNASLTSTYGVGELIKAALKHGSRKLVIGLGGSATNDGGTGAAAALGVRFLDDSGQSFVPVGGTLSRIKTIDMTGLLPEVRESEIITMCDIDNPLCGPQGAAAVFAPQKGATPDDIEQLDAGLRHLADLVDRDLGQQILDLPGSGAAGGMGGGTVAFLGAALEMGIETVLNMTRFDELIRDADLVISGEGKIDGQSLRGKVVIGVGRRTRKQGIPLIAVVGDIGDDVSAAYDEGVSGIFSINRVAVPYAEAKKRARSDLALTIDNLFRFIKTLTR